MNIEDLTTDTESLIVKRLFKRLLIHSRFISHGWRNW